MNDIDFFGCSFTEGPNTKEKSDTEEFDILNYSVHCQNTKTISGFLDFDLSFNDEKNYRINNYGGGSFGNHLIKEVLQNKIKKLDKSKENIVFVQLSALLRNELSYETVFNSEHSLLKKTNDIFFVDSEKVRADYFVETDNLVDYYNQHILNIKEIIKLCKENYSHHYIHFGWDISTPEFIKMFRENDLEKDVHIFNYKYKVSKLQYFENCLNYSPLQMGVSGSFGGMLDYSSNKIDEKIRYVHISEDHHPSYFSNKIFYLDIIKPFLKQFIKLEKNYFQLDSVVKFENFLAELLPTKESANGKVYGEMQTKIVNFIKNNIQKQ